MSQATQIAKTRRTPLDWIAYAVATGAGAGFFPIAPGTVGAAEGVALYLIIAQFNARWLNLGWPQQIALLVGLNILIYAVGVWAAGRTCDMSRTKDPHIVVIDEVSGQLISLIPLALSPSLTGIIAAFALFRFFDIFKPYPIRKLEDLPRGFGVMTDDALAGVYAAVLISVGFLLHLF